MLSFLFDTAALGRLACTVIIKNIEIEPVIIFYLCTGIRKNELTTFDVDKDLNVKLHYITIKSEKKRNNNQFREIDITDKLANYILNNRTAFNLTTNQIYRKFKALLDANNIKGSLHNLRHTFATNHYYLGTPAKQVQQWLGHEKIELTQNIYTHIDRTITKQDILDLYGDYYYKI